MKECKHCGSKVTDRFAKVLSNDKGEIYACQNCAPNSGIVQKARRREVELNKSSIEDDKEDENSDYKDLSYIAD